MAKYKISLVRTIYEEITVEADNVDDAVEKACWEAAWDNCCMPADWDVDQIDVE